MNDASTTWRWAKAYPDMGDGPVSIEPCVSPAYFELEREKLFPHVWLNVGRVEEIPQPGDYVVKDLYAAQASVIVIRGKDQKIRAFHNMCSHRGNQVLWHECGNCN